MKNSQKKPKTNLRQRWASKHVRLGLNVVWLLALLFVAIYFEMPHTRRADVSKCKLVEEENSDVSENTYAKLTSVGYRDLRSRRVTMVALKRGIDPAKALDSRCQQRGYEARLVHRLSDGGAAVIVLDKFFDPDSCDRDDPGTVALLNAIQTSPRPVVVAVATHAPKEDPKGSCLILNSSLDFGNKLDAEGKPTDKPAAILSLSRLNKNPLKIPVNWYVYKDDPSFDAHHDPDKTLVETLSYQAAVLADHGLKNEDRLNRLREADRHPFAPFIDPDSFSQLDAVDYLCSSPERAQIETSYKINCAEHPKVDTDLGGRVVVIGEDSPGLDVHKLFEKNVSGVYLQANYIESLLEGNYLKALGTGWDITIFVVWLAVLYLLYWFIQPELSLVVSLLIGALGWYAIRQLVLMKGLYPEVWVQELSLIALILKYIDARGHKLGELIRHRLEERNAHSS
jgi:hypothetical protein